GHPVHHRVLMHAPPWDSPESRESCRSVGGQITTGLRGSMSTKLTLVGPESRVRDPSGTRRKRYVQVALHRAAIEEAIRDARPAVQLVHQGLSLRLGSVPGSEFIQGAACSSMPSQTSSASELGIGVGGARTGEGAGTWACNPRCSRIRLETSPSSINAITRMR